MAKLDFKVSMRSSSWAVATVGKLMVGSATAWFDCNDRWVILGSEVRPRYRRRGIATAMYKAIEAESGKLLTPAISLSDDGFEFWKAYRPESVALDLRHRPDLIGRKAMKNGKVGKITKASGGVAVIEYEDGMTSCILRDDLDAHLLSV